jgi:hypothetical protein
MVTVSRLALAFSIVGLVLAGYAVASTGFKSGSSQECGRQGGYIACNGRDAPPQSFGACTPQGANGGVMYWRCKPQ